MRYFSICIALLFSLSACKPINQKVNKQRHGLWIEKYSQDSLQYRSIGRYYKGDPVKRWRYYLDDKIKKKKKYKPDYCIRTNYHQNGKVQSKGRTAMKTRGKNLHWFYAGDWEYFDDKGKLIATKKYDNGELVSETTAK